MNTIEIRYIAGAIDAGGIPTIVRLVVEPNREYNLDETACDTLAGHNWTPCAGPDGTTMLVSELDTEEDRFNHLWAGALDIG